jgi:hypothetical protein
VDGVVAAEELAHILLTVVLVGVKEGVLDSTLGRILEEAVNEVVTKLRDEGDSELDGLGYSDEVKETDTDSQLV